MKYADLEPLSFSELGLFEEGARAWRLRDRCAELGSCFWELRYFQASLGIGDPAAWRKAQCKQGVWQKLCSMWALPASVVHHPPPKGHSDGQVRELLCASGMIAPLLLDIVTRRGPGMAERRALAEAKVRQWLRLACRGFEGTSGELRYQTGHTTGRLRIASGGVVEGWGALVVVYPHFDELWARYKGGWMGHLRLPDDPRAANLSDLVLFLYLVVQVRGSVTGEPTVEQRLLQVAGRMAAWGLERFVARVHAPALGPERPPPLRKLMSKRRRRRIDPGELAALRDKVKTLAGSSRAAIAAITGDPSANFKIIHIHNLLYLGKLEPTFHDSAFLSLAWDPGTYGGESTFCGVAYNPESQQSSVLPIKAAAYQSR